MVVEPLVMMLLAMGSVGLWTMRVTISAQGRKALGSTVAALEAVVFAVAFSHLVTDIGRPDRMAGYAVGVALGTLIGLTVTDGLTRHDVEIEVVVPGADRSLIARLHGCGWPATWHHAAGPNGEVTVVLLAVDGADVDGLLELFTEVAPDAFWTTRPLGRTHPVARGPAPDRSCGPRVRPSDRGRRALRR